MTFIKREANFGRLFRHWIKANPQKSAAFELKQTTTNRFAYRDIPDHQLTALSVAKHGELLYKIPDDSRGVKPFDMVYLATADAFVVILYPGFFVLVDVDAFIREQHKGEKSLSGERAKAIASSVIDL